ncbi:MAG: c-type cytochrome [Fuerstiella sp.]|nr:c-type cytochrome [Fuerstiella sp.]MCP4856282.1 c-type cytochrome [Fuerstiella sp.]
MQLVIIAHLQTFADEPTATTESIATLTFDDGTDGCRPLNQIQLSASDGALHVVGEGGDPHFVAPAAGGTAAWKKLVIRARFRGRLTSQIFWTTDAEPNTSEENSVRFRMKGGGKNWTEQTVFFRTTAPLKEIRFDPHDAPFEMDIDSLAVFDSGPPPADPATDPAGFKTIPGFQVELLYSVPMQAQGSWVSMTVDPKGRLIVCDQYGSLYRVTPKPVGETGVAGVESLGVEIGSAQGLLYAFDSLYVMVSSGDASGLYRVTDSDGDDQFDTVRQLQKLSGALGEHGPHAIALSPDGQSLYVVAGNNTILPERVQTFRSPKNWAEDQLLPRDPCSNGHNTDRMAPGGWVCRVSPDGEEWELVSAGFRNPYDIAFNRDGELFTYDADMEMDVGTPWYRPTRVCHVVSGGEFGWRWGTGKWPAYSPDSLPSVADIGLGSPTGVAFGYGADFPSEYQDALYVCDWTYGRLFALHLTAKGASYTGRLEEFITGTPLALTDIVVNPVDRAMYFTVGGRRTQSGLYRVTWTGKKTAPNKAVGNDTDAAQLRRLRKELESLHVTPKSDALNRIWTNLSHDDRHIRFAARIALEHLAPELWTSRALRETQPDAAIGSLLALARTAGAGRHKAIVNSLTQLAQKDLTNRQRVDLLRALAVTFARHGRPNQKSAARLMDVLEPMVPAGSTALNHELCRMLVYLKSEQIVSAAVQLMAESVTQEDLLAYGMMLRVAEQGWTDTTRRTYFSLLNKIEAGAATADYVGGGHLQIYTQRFRDAAVERLSEAHREMLSDVVNAKLPSTVPTGSPTPRPFVRNWTGAELLPELDRVGGGRSFKNGQNMFTVANCAQCHRFNNIGGILGPDITGAAKRYNRAVMVREILEPSAQISDQFRTHVILTQAGLIYEGRVINRSDSGITVAADPKRPASVVQIATDDIDEMIPSKVSMMPKDLLNTLSVEDILDLLAFIEAAGDSEHPNFRK